MNKRILATFLALCMTLSLISCGAANTTETSDVSNNNEASEESVEQSNEIVESSMYESSSDAETPAIYPIAIESSLYDYATSVPNVIYTTPAEENGLSGNPYFVTGVVTQIVNSEDSAYGARYFIVENEYGEVYFLDFIDSASIYTESTSAEVMETFKSLYSSDYDNTFPESNQVVTVYGLYNGYSNAVNAPIFYFGLNENLQKQLLENPENEYVSNTVAEETSEQSSTAESDTTAEITMAQNNALKKAKEYLRIMAFSYSGLVKQLEYEGYTSSEATYAADNCGADWNEQAVKKAIDYLDTAAFSRSGLIDQLKYEGFTSEQAEYGVSAVGY